MSTNEIKQHGTDSLPFELYDIDNLHPRYHMVFHWHDQIELIRILTGKLSLTLDRECYTLSEGSYAFVNPRTIHGAAPEDCVYQCVVFNPEFLKSKNSSINAFIDRLVSHEIRVPDIIENEELKGAARELFEAMESGEPFEIIGSAMRVFGKIRSGHVYEASTLEPDSENAQKLLRLQMVLRFIRAHYMEDVSLEMLSDVAELSPKYFCSFFRSMTGVTPIDYLVSYRIERASRKLLESSDTVTKIALDCGFNDLSYFIKTFKAQKGVTPSGFRRRK